MSRFEPMADHSGISSGSELSAWATIRRGAAISPELTRGLGVTVVLAVLSTLGRVLVPFVAWTPAPLPRAASRLAHDRGSPPPPPPFHRPAVLRI